MHAINTGTYWSKLVLPVVYSVQRPELKNQFRTDGHMVPTPTWKDGTDFPCHEMNALEIHSIVASCKYSN